MSITALEHELRTAAERLRASQDVKGRIDSDSRELLELVGALLRLRQPLALLLDCQARYAATSGMYDVLAVDVARAVNDTAEPLGWLADAIPVLPQLHGDSAYNAPANEHHRREDADGR